MLGLTILYLYLNYMWCIVIWNQLNVQSASDWTARQGHAAVAYKQSIYLMGGFGEAGYCNSCYQGCTTKVYLPVQISKPVPNATNENNNIKDTIEQDEHVIYNVYSFHMLLLMTLTILIVYMVCIIGE